MQLYLQFKQAQGLRPITLKGHGDVTRLFFRRHPEAWQGGQKLQQAVYCFFGEDIKPATYNIRRNYLKQFFDWCVKEGFFADNPLDGFKKRKDEGRIVPLDAETLSRLISLPNKNTFAGLRDYALILLTLDTGIRPKEAFSLLQDDINLRSMEVYVRSDVAKTKVSRTLPVSTATAEALRLLLAARHLSWGEHVPVFCSSEGTPLRNDTWDDRLEKYSKALGIRIHPYDLRHAFALQFLRCGGNAFALQRIMGHSDLSIVTLP